MNRPGGRKDPLIRFCRFMAFVVMSNANSAKPVGILATTYMVFVSRSITGVLVIPKLGFKLPQPCVLTDGPKCMDQMGKNVCASNAYTQFSSVAIRTVLRLDPSANCS